jgi:type II secretory pathway component PulF
MNNTDDVEAMKHLRQAGWTSLEIERLRQFRQMYTQKGELPLRDHQSSTFVRKLISFLQKGFSSSGPS